MFSLFIWPHQYYLPNYPETYKNEWRFKNYKEALKYAQSLGMKTYLHHSYNAVPPFFIYNHPDLDARNEHYRGFLACWSKGKEKIFPLTKQVINYFVDVVNGYILWFADPAFCGCNECRDYAAVVLDYLDTIKRTVRNRSIHPCIWGFSGIERGTYLKKLSMEPNPGLLQKVLNTINKKDFVISSDRLFQKTKKQGQTVLEFGFFLDPEGGSAKSNVLPQPKFHEIEEAMKTSIERNSEGTFAYRLTPYTQFASDWVFYRKLVSPKKTVEEAVAELGHYIYPLESQASDFSKALMLLDKWWREKNITDLRKSVKLLDATRTKTPTNTTYLADAAEILLMLAEQVKKEEPIEEFVLKVQEKMNGMPIFQGFTIDQIWQGSRIKFFLTPRTKWWIERINK
jgi:hypothetical protein